MKVIDMGKNMLLNKRRFENLKKEGIVGWDLSNEKDKTAICDVKEGEILGVKFLIRDFMSDDKAMMINNNGEVEAIIDFNSGEIKYKDDENKKYFDKLKKIIFHF